jgi:hydroxymethylglutaryl-CoA reductase
VIGLAHEQFTRILAEVAVATSFEEAKAIVRAAALAGELGAVDESQFGALCDAVREKEGAP